MRSCGCRGLLWGAVVTAGLSVIAGCSSGNDSAHRTSATQAPSAEDHQTPQAAPPGPVGVSPSGVTTRVDAPADSTELEYYQACHQAKVWLEGQQGDPQSLIEPYLATVQAPGPGDAGTWNTPWAELTSAHQAAVIVAVHAAANDECG